MAPVDPNWTPDKPLPDAKVEEEAQERAQASARVKYLTEKYSTPAAAPPKKRGPFGD